MKTINFTDSVEALSYLESQFATLQSYASISNAMVGFAQDTAGRSQAQIMNVNMNAGKKIKDVDLSQNMAEKIETVKELYAMLQAVSKSLNINIARYNTTFHTNIRPKVLHSEKGVLFATDMLTNL